MSKERLYPVPTKWSGDAWIDAARYQTLYRQSLDEPEVFWAEQSDQFLTWQHPWEKLNSTNFAKAEASWFVGGKLNVTVNCIDRHLEDHSDQTAIIWEADDPSEHSEITYAELHKQVSKFGNLLRKLGVKKGDPVCIYMPMIPEAAYAMLACARIGAIHSVVFGGFSPEALKDRILDCDCRVVITADEGIRGGKKIPLKQSADKAINNCPDVRHCIVVKRTGGSIDWSETRDIDSIRQ